MKFVRFSHSGGVSYGALEGRLVREIDRPPWESRRQTGRDFPLEAVKLLAPCTPSKIFALAHNFPDHQAGHEPPREPQIFLKVPSSVIGPGERIVLPRGQGRVDEEAELVAVIGRRCRGVSEPEALKCVFGFTCGNDVSARDWQKRDLNWWRAKSADTFSPLGPCIDTEADGRELTIRGRVNGREVQNGTSRDLIFGVARLIEWISAWVTLEPGDLIFTGTSGQPAELHPGDTVEVEIAGIGLLENPVV